ncbi:MAG: HAD hydrolase family protein, partial [Clostridia bacterium]|nr:HAD hydrolase family protein [Clostridia bacterium]
AFDPAVGVRVVTPDGFMTDGRGEIIAGEVARNPLDFPHVTEIDHWTTCNPAEQWFKLVFRAEPEQLDALRPQLVGQFGDRFEFAASGPRFLELTTKGCTKASDVQRLRELFAAQGKRLLVVACGDQENDLAMLGAADLAFCPENATDQVKEICAQTLCHHAKGLMPEVVECLRQRGWI